MTFGSPELLVLAIGGALGVVALWQYDERARRRIAAHLGEAGLVDEYQFVIIPIALGSGRTVFTGRRDLRRIEQRAFSNGNVVVTYAVA